MFICFLLSLIHSIWSDLCGSFGSGLNVSESLNVGMPLKVKLSYALDGIGLMVHCIHTVYTYFLIDNSLSSSIPSVHLRFMYLPTGVSFEQCSMLALWYLILVKRSLLYQFFDGI